MNWALLIIGLSLILSISGCAKVCLEGFCCPKEYIEECVGSSVQIEGAYSETAAIGLIMDDSISSNNIQPNTVELVVDNLNLLGGINFHDKILVTGIVEEYEVEYIESGKQKRTRIRVFDMKRVE